MRGGPPTIRVRESPSTPPPRLCVHPRTRTQHSVRVPISAMVIGPQKTTTYRRCIWPPHSGCGFRAAELQTVFVVLYNLQGHLTRSSRHFIRVLQREIYPISDILRGKDGYPRAVRASGDVGLVDTPVDAGQARIDRAGVETREVVGFRPVVPAGDDGALRLVVRAKRLPLPLPP